MMRRGYGEQFVALLAATVVTLTAGGSGARVVPTRLFFQPGSSSAYAKGEVPGGARRDYVLAVNAGQKITVTLESENPAVTFSVAPIAGGSALGGGRAGAEHAWSGTLAEAGDYLISVEHAAGGTPVAAPARFRLVATLS